ncbi:hypothetical protein NE237_007054 [Protea cynaroides]|uniref:F-box domain-containing protein n=1 Tax=Protea cynaroides TaxID=273540 RepID=A0A9Q0KNQ6_9MAGN|nr:hypothetical protein NE237_007054 [Protea cynaroides]
MEKSDEGENSSSSSSRRSIVSSNEDLMVNILSRLSMKVLLRFKCVSKQWNLLISDPYFVSTHQGRATQNQNIIKLLWMTHDGSIGVCSIDEKEERKGTHDLIRSNYPDGFKCHFVHMVRPPCNGLICLENRCSNGFFMVYNPTTRNTLVIPRGKEREYDYLEGLGFCSSSNEFKLVHLYLKSEGYGYGYGYDYGCELSTVGQRGVHPQQPSRSWPIP